MLDGYARQIARGAMVPSTIDPIRFAVPPLRFAVSQYRSAALPLRRLLVLLAVLATVHPACAASSAVHSKAKRHAAATEPTYATRADVRAFVDELVRDDGFDRRQLLRWFGQARFQPRIVAAMQRPLLEPPKWFEYAPRFLSTERIDGGVAFLRAHQATLSRAEGQFGVPAEIIVAIIGVETYYGRNTGSHRVIDALSTLAFDYPRRANFFRGELREFLMFARDERLSPLEPKGSFAGAIGVPQFMPGSVRRYAIDFDGDGHVDLWRSDDDAIGSVANYLARHDWMRGQPVLLPAVLDDAARGTVLRRLDGGISERRPMAAWESDGVRTAGAPADLAPEPVGLLLLEESADWDAGLGANASGAAGVVDAGVKARSANAGGMPGAANAGAAAGTTSAGGATAPGGSSAAASALDAAA
jgi:membrane-bound lytic murein transglycosylase B